MTKDRLFGKWFLLKHIDPALCDDPAKAFNAILNIKSEIREHYKNENRKDPVSIIDSNDYGYYTELIKLPEFIKTENEADYYFKYHYYSEYIPSQYDCTGQHFTIWYKIVKRSYGYVVFNHVGIDC